MAYGDLLPSLIANQLAVVTLGRIFQSPFPKWYNPSATCTYHGGTLGHLVKQCIALKHKVQSLIEAEWLMFQEDGAQKANIIEYAEEHPEPIVGCGLCTSIYN